MGCEKVGVKLQQNKNKAPTAENKNIHNLRQNKPKVSLKILIVFGTSLLQGTARANLNVTCLCPCPQTMGCLYLKMIKETNRLGFSAIEPLLLIIGFSLGALFIMWG